LAKVTAQGQLTPEGAALFEELGVDRPSVPALTEQAAADLPAGASQQDRGERAVEDLARTLARISIADIAVFFAVLLVGFAYVWRRGDLDWVRAVRSEQDAVVNRLPPATVLETEPAISV
jgi:NADH-quinone oxidoreductase subunit A